MINKIQSCYIILHIRANVTTMKKEIVTVVYDRKKEVTKRERGKVEIRIYLGNGIRKYITINDCDPFEWMAYQSSQELRNHVCIYRQLVNTMVKNYEELTIENIDNHLGIDWKNWRTGSKCAGFSTLNCTAKERHSYCGLRDRKSVV